MGLPETARTMSPLRGWWPIIVLPGAVLLLTPLQRPRWLFMWSLASALFLGCKWLTWRRTPVCGSPLVAERRIPAGLAGDGRQGLLATGTASGP